MKIEIQWILHKIEGIERNNPLELVYEDDARYTWPARWRALVDYLVNMDTGEVKY